MKKVAAVITGILSISALIFAEQAANGKTGTVEGSDKLTITVGSALFAAKLENNAAAAMFKAKLPMTLEMNELGRQEKYFKLSESLPTDALRPGTVRAGDLMLYGTDTIVLFYETSANPYSYTRLGRIDDPAGLKAALGTTGVTVTFEQPEQENEK